MNGQTLTYEQILTEVTALERAITSLKIKLTKLLPPKYGSDEWWEESDRKGLEDIEAGRYKKFTSIKALMKDLNN